MENKGLYGPTKLRFEEAKDCLLRAQQAISMDGMPENLNERLEAAKFAKYSFRDILTILTGKDKEMYLLVESLLRQSEDIISLLEMEGASEVIEA